MQELAMRKITTASDEANQESALESAEKSADFSIFEGDNLLKPELENTLFVTKEEALSDEFSIKECIYNPDITTGQSELYGATFQLNKHMSVLLDNHTDWYSRRSYAVKIADSFYEELLVNHDVLTHEQQSAIVMSKLYLSSVSSIGLLGQFAYTRFWLRRKAEETQEAKLTYLHARKRFQDDIDSYFDHFADEEDSKVYEALNDTVTMARLLVNKQRWASALTDDYNHQFIGSVLSERAVMMGLQDNGFPLARYGTAEEDSKPTKADVVVPLESGNMFVQVKMKWLEPTELDIREAKTPMNVIVPMHQIRSNLSAQEGVQVAESVTAVAERLAA